MGAVEGSARPDTETSRGIYGVCLDNFEFQQDDIPPGGLEHCSPEDASPMPRSIMPSVFCPRILP